jgi:hypothetical protein
MTIGERQPEQLLRVALADHDRIRRKHCPPLRCLIVGVKSFCMFLELGSSRRSAPSA